MDQIVPIPQTAPPPVGLASPEGDRLLLPVVAPAPGDAVAIDENPPVSSDAQRAIERLAERVQQLMDTADAPTLLKQLFCHELDWRYVNEPVPNSALPESARGAVAEATIIAMCDEIRLCYLRMSKSDLLAGEQRKPLDRLSRGWPSVLVAFANFGQTQIDFCCKTAEGKIARISLDRNLFGPDELAQAIYAMRAFDVKTEEPAPQLVVAERLERQLKRVPLRHRQRRGLSGDPFFRELRRHELLLHAAEKSLRRQFTAGEKHGARDKLVLANLRLVVWVADRYRARGVEWDDLLQEGVCGLLRAADRYDPERDAGSAPTPRGGFGTGAQGADQRDSRNDRRGCRDS